MNDTPVTEKFMRWGSLQGHEIVSAAVARVLERRVNRLTTALTKCRERVKYQEPKLTIMEEIDQALEGDIQAEIRQQFTYELNKEEAMRKAAGIE